MEKREEYLKDLKEELKEELEKGHFTSVSIGLTEEEIEKLVEEGKRKRERVIGCL